MNCGVRVGRRRGYYVTGVPPARARTPPIRKLFPLLIACLFVPALASGGSWIAEPPQQRLIASAREATEQRRWGQAEALWRRAILFVNDRREPAEALRRLHEQGLVSLEPDEASIESLREELGAGFYRVETDWFVALSDCDEVWTAARAGVLERTARQFRNMMERLGVEWTPPEHKLVCVLFAEHAEFARFAKERDGVEATWVSGYYTTSNNRTAFYDESTSPAVRRAMARLREAETSSSRDPSVTMRDARAELERHAREASIAKTVHEAIHMLAFNCGLQRRSRSYPFWFTEGLAGSFETTEPRHNFGPTIEQDGVRRQLRAFVADGRLMDMTALIGIVDAKGVDSDVASVMYAMSNSFFRYLYRFEREGLAGYARALWHAEARELRADEHVALFREHVGDEQRLARRWLERWVRE